MRLRRDHPTRGRMCSVERAVEVDGHDPLELGRRELGERCDIRDPRVVHHRRDRTEHRFHLVERDVDGRRILDAQRKRQCGDVVTRGHPIRN